jgi:hypothetical protein
MVHNLLAGTAFAKADSDGAYAKKVARMTKSAVGKPRHRWNCCHHVQENRTGFIRMFLLYPHDLQILE